MTPVTGRDTALWYALATSLSGTEVESWDYPRRQRLVSKMDANVRSLAHRLSAVPVEKDVEVLLRESLRSVASSQGLPRREATRLADRATANVGDAARALRRDAQ